MLTAWGAWCTRRLWVQDEPFTVGLDGTLAPVAAAATALPLNSGLTEANASSGQPAHWVIHPGKEGTPRTIFSAFRLGNRPSPSVCCLSLSLS